MIAITNTSLCRNGKQGIAQLCQSNAQQIQLILRQPAGKRVGQSGNGSGQFAGIHGAPPLSYPMRMRLRGVRLFPFEPRKEFYSST